jgi:M6 family metalloprotease-like protein
MVIRIHVVMAMLESVLLSLVLLPHVTVLAMIPPHPEIPNNITTTRRTSALRGSPYRTRLLNPELCRSEGAELCEEMDKDLVEHADRTRTLVETTGNLKVLVLLLQFQDHTTRNLVDSADIGSLFNSEGKRQPVIPTGSIKSYLRINSHGKLVTNATVVPWLPVDFTEEYCTFGNSGLDRRFQECFAPLLDALDFLHASTEHSFDWSEYDRNGDGYLDSVVVMTSSYGAEWGGIDPSGKVSSDRIWSHSIGPQSIRWKSQHYAVELGTYCVSSVFKGYEGSSVASIGIVVHELIHTFGIPDLFDLSRSDQMGGVGSYSVMSDAWGQAGDSTFPGHLDPWSKIQLGWVTPKEITSNGNYEMGPSETTPDIYIIDAPYPDGEYLLIENRQPLHFDSMLWTGGALIWHIDDSVPLNTNAGGPYQPGWPQNGNHYRVALVQADGLFELEQAINKGHAADFYKGGMSLGPGQGNAVFPNTDAYKNGRIIKTNIELSNFVKLGLSVDFTVSGFSETDGDGPPPDVPGSPLDPLELPPNQNACLVRVNTQLCSNHMERILPEAGCDCYNICGNGAGQGCCAFGELCHINCHAGGLIAGCTHEEAPGALRSQEQDPQYILIERMEDREEDQEQDEDKDEGSAATQLASSTWLAFVLLVIGYIRN